jgi:hypothetical protein
MKNSNVKTRLLRVAPEYVKDLSSIFYKNSLQVSQILTFLGELFKIHHALDFASVFLSQNSCVPLPQSSSCFSLNK